MGSVILAWALRLPPLLDTPLHPDEALYGYWGLLIGSGQDPWLISESIYKPPLLPYVLSLSELVLGGTTIALRLPGLLTGVLAVPLVGALASALYEDLWTGLASAATLALAPFAVAFSGSAFPDTFMVTLGLAACVAAARRRASWAGLLAGLSIATKQTGLVWLPLVAGITAGGAKRPVKRVGRLILSCILPTALIVAWDLIRVAQGADSFWSSGVVGFGGLRLIWSHELWSRLRAWCEMTGPLLGSPIANTLLAVGSPALVWLALGRRPGTRSAFFDLLLVAFSLAYFSLHWLIAFPIWRRYLLPLLPLFAVLLGRIVRQLVSHAPGPVRPWQRNAVGCLVLVALLLPPAGRAASGRSAVAEDRSIYAPVDEVAAFLSGLEDGTVVYHHWLGWHYHFALFDAPVYLAFWPNPAWLARDVQAFGAGSPRYIAFPPWESASRVARALSRVGYRLDAVSQLSGDGIGSFVVYRIVSETTL